MGLSAMPRVHVPGGQYKIGTNNHACGNPSRAVTLTRGFNIGTHCITNQQRKDTFHELAVCGDTHVLMVTAQTGRKIALAWGNPKTLAHYVVSGDLPVELLRVVPDPDELLKAIPENRRRPNQPAVSWLRHELIAFANRQGGRLPTEVEWEIAARTADGDARVFDYSTPNGQLRDGVRKLANFGGDALVDVYDSEFAPNRRGIWHMTGGVWEATDTILGAVDVNEVIDPTGAKEGRHPSVRGGSSSNDEDCLLAANRCGSDGPSVRVDDLGGRLAWRSQHLNP